MAEAAEEPCTRGAVCAQDEHPEAAAVELVLRARRDDGHDAERRRQRRRVALRQLLDISCIEHELDVCRRLHLQDTGEQVLLTLAPLPLRFALAERSDAVQQRRGSRILVKRDADVRIERLEQRYCATLVALL